MGERRGQFIVSCGCIHWEFFPLFLPTSVNYTNRFRRGNVSFWKLFLKEKRKQHTRVQIFRLSLATPLTFSHQHPVAARRMPVRQQRQSGKSSCKKSSCDFFFFFLSMICLFWILKKFCGETAMVKLQCWMGCSRTAWVQKCKLLLEVVPDVTI